MPLSRKGQMSLVVILMVAVAFVLYAVTINWSRIASTKTTVTIASNSAAAALVSLMAGYGENLIQTQLGGEAKKCGFTGVLAAIIALVAIVVLTCVIPGAGEVAGSAMGLSAGTVAAISIGLAVAAIVLQVTVVQPGLTKMWNKWQKNLPTIEDKYLENGISTALNLATGDPVLVTDRWDLDGNTHWYIREYPQKGDPAAKVSRFAFYYTDRMRGIPLPPTTAIDTLRQTLQGVVDALGLSGGNPAVCYVDLGTGPQLRPQCNPCCTDPTMRPAACSLDPKKPELVPQECLSAPGCAPSANQLTACYAYDPLYVQKNVSTSFLSVMGMDDANKKKYFSAGAEIPDPWMPIFRGADSTGKIFPFLWLLADTAPMLKDINAADMRAEAPGCHWCDKRVTPCSLTTPPFSPPPTPTRLLFRPAGTTAYDQLSLPTCVGEDCCVNTFNNNVSSSLSYSNFKLDVVPDIESFRPVADSDCARDPAVEAGTKLLWKKGADRYSDTFQDPSSNIVYPVKMEQGSSSQPVGVCNAAGAPAAIAANCMCPNVDHKDLWYDDGFDAMSTGMAYFLQTVTPLLTTNPATQAQLAYSVAAWKAAVIAQGMELGKMEARMQRWIDEINTWLKGPYTDANAWCLPTDLTTMTAKEKNYILATPSPWGSVDSVLRCLDYNSNLNQAFAACAGALSANPTACVAAAACKDLPRSLVPGFDPNNDLGRNVAAGTCSADYIKKISNSATLAVNQSIKMKARAAYLRDLLQHMKDFLPVLQKAHDDIAGKGQQIIGLVNSIDAVIAAAPHLGNQVIYGWLSPRPGAWNTSNAATRKGYLHLVKVEAAIPKHGGAGFNTCTNTFPWIRTYTEGILSMTRCYEISDADGCVGTRVIRYDEDHDPAQGGVLKLLSGLPIWQILYRNPHNRNTDVGYNVSDIYRNCIENHYSRKSERDAAGNVTNSYVRLEDTSAAIMTQDNLNEAFMINLPLESSMPGPLIECYNAAEALLSKGVVSETCARYFISGNKMQMTFRRCSECCSQ